MLTMPQTIFVVEDDPDISALLRRHLLAAGFAVRNFSQPDTVVWQAKAEPPALFLLDIMLPGGSGMDLCRSIRRTEELARTPVIFLTAKNTEADKVAGLEIGADDFITKPFSPRELVARVKAVLRRFEPPLTPEKLQFG